MCKNNMKYLGGAFSWTCASCQVLKSTAQHDLMGDRLKVLESYIVQAVQDRPLKNMLENVLKELAAAKENSSYASAPTHANLVQSASGPAVKTNTQEDSSNVISQATWPLPSEANILPYKGDPTNTHKRIPPKPHHNRQSGGKPKESKFKVKLTNTQSDAPVRRVLGKYASNGTLDKDYEYKPKGKDTVELLFDSQESALAEYDKLKALLTDLEVNPPDMAKARRAYLVGLEDYHTAKDVLEEIERKYGDTLQLKTANKSCLRILEIEPCNNDPDTFRATLELSEELLTAIEKRLSNKLRIGFVGCTVYPFRNHGRCNKCQDHEHKWKQCKAKDPSCANCAGDHDTNKCTSNVIRCINCLKSEKYKDQADGHKASSLHCPVYFEHQQQASKKGSRLSA